MAIYILLGNLTEEGADMLRINPEWVSELQEDLDEFGVEIIAQYAVLGPYDFVTIVQAEDNRSIVRVSAELTMRGKLKIVTLPAIPMEDFIASL